MVAGFLEHESIYAAFLHAAGQWPDRPFVHVLEETARIYRILPGEMTYSDTLRQVTRLREEFAQAGYGPGMRVLILVENRPQFFTCWLALNALGVSIVPLNPDLRSSELEYIARHARPDLAISTVSRQASMQDASSASQAGFACMAPGEETPKPANRQDPGRGHDQIRQNDEAAMLYTSGTTGNPKGCVLSNLYFLNAGHWYANAGGICALSKQGERMITPLPLFHMNALAYSAMAMIAVGGCLTILDRFHPASWWESVRESRATCLHYLGVMPSILMKADRVPGERDHRVKFGFGAGIDPELHVAFEERFAIPLVEAWAMTETGAGAVIAANREPRKRGVSCLGRPGPQMQARIVGDDGKDVQIGEPGELLVRSSSGDPRFGFFTEYYRDDDATREAWQGGWFHTGDIVRRDKDGDYFFVDRKKNVIRRSGENIAAVEVESVLMQHPQIKAAGVAAVPDDIRGDEVFACIVYAGDRTSESARSIAQWCLARMAYFKVPGFIAFVDALPLTATQKIQRRELKTLAQTLRDNAGTTDLRAMKKRQAA